MRGGWWTSSETFIPRKTVLPLSALDVRYAPALRFRESYYLHSFTALFKTRLKGNFSSRTRYMLRFSQDFAGLGGDVKSVTSTALGVAETKIWGEDVTLRAELEGGAVHMMGGQTSRVTDRFRNYSRIRGFKANGIGPRDQITDEGLGGNYFVALRTDVEFPIGLPEEYGVHGGAFVDAGSIWGLDIKAGAGGQTVDDGRHLRAAAGLSLYWDTPIGPLRMNYAKTLKKQDYDEDQRFELTVSTKF